MPKRRGNGTIPDAIRSTIGWQTKAAVSTRNTARAKSPEARRGRSTARTARYAARSAPWRRSTAAISPAPTSARSTSRRMRSAARLVARRGASPEDAIELMKHPATAPGVFLGPGRSVQMQMVLPASRTAHAEFAAMRRETLLADTHNWWKDHPKAGRADMPRRAEPVASRERRLSATGAAAAPAPDVVPDFVLEQHLFFWFTQVLDRRDRQLAAALKADGLRAPEWRILATLHSRHRLSMSELADLTSIERTTL